MSESTFHVTSEDVRKMEAKESKFHDGKTPKDSDASAMKVCHFALSFFPFCFLFACSQLLKSIRQQILSEQESKEAEIDRVKAGLPLPEQPVGGASADLQSADQRTVNVGSGGVNVKLGTQSSEGLRVPATAESSVRTDGAEWKKETAP